MSALILADALGPRGRRRVRLLSLVAYVAFAVGAVLVVRRFDSRGQLLWSKWNFITDQKLMRFLLRGLRDTLTAALVAMAIALVLGALGAYFRLSPSKPLRVIAIGVVELLRATPLVLLIYFMGQFIPRYGTELGSYWYLVIGLAAYNSAVIAEIFRAGVNSLPRGQREAGLTIGFTEGEVLRRILFPQGVRRMVPALVNPRRARAAARGERSTAPRQSVGRVQEEPAAGLHRGRPHVRHYQLRAVTGCHLPRTPASFVRALLTRIE
jgi:glutamate transport system permease protein